MANYLVLCEARKTKKAHSDVVANLFTKNVFSRHLRFLITSEETLAEFWEYFLISKDLKCDDLSDAIRTVFSIADIQRRLKVNCDIFVEESETKKYFTITHIDEIPKKVLELTLRKNQFVGTYKVDNGKISFELDMKYTYPEVEQIEAPIKIPRQKVRASTTETFKPAPMQEEAQTPVTSSKPVSIAAGLKVFDYMDEEDLYDLEEYAGKLSSIMLIVGGGDVTEDEVVEIYSYLDKIGSVLATYSEVYPIAKALSALSVDMSSHMHEFIENSEALGPMCKAFANDMTNWIQMSFHTGAPSPDFMNDSIVVNCQTISGMLKINEQTIDDSDFDDIFDF
jgi:hypothetical protein